jgi:hypothetical protein
MVPVRLAGLRESLPPQRRQGHADFAPVEIEHPSFMSGFISIEDRIERLENQVANLCEQNRLLAKMVAGRAVVDVSLLEALIAQGISFSAFMSLFGQAKLLGTEALNQKFVDLVSRAERRDEVFEHMLMKLKQNSQGDGGTAEPPSA